jgi:ATP-dependent Clp protease ATP-binding subunit ClpA
MFERFTKLARQSLVDAQLEAASLGHNFIGTEHLLLGVLRLGDGIAFSVLSDAGVSFQTASDLVAEIIGGPDVDAGALASIGIDVDAVRGAVEASFGPGALERAVSGRPRSCRRTPFTARAKKVLQLSLSEALALKHNFIGTEHLLLAMVREGDGVAAVVLRRLLPGTDIRSLVIERLRNAS